MAKASKSQVLKALDFRNAARLQNAGFQKTSGKEWQWCRNASERLDFLGIFFADVKGYVPTGLSSMSFQLEVGVFVKAIPHPMAASFNGVDGLPAKSAADCHFRYHVDPPRLLSGLRQTGFWYVDPLALILSSVAGAVGNAIGEKIFPWFDEFLNLSKVFEESLVAISKKELGRSKSEAIRSHNLVLGFLAFHLQQWQEAKRFLQATKAMKNPVHLVDSKEPELLYGKILPEIDKALSVADKNLSANE